ncbi:MAG: beta-lactamase family protein [Clostridia bacterium]|nr:beta-lactamase family protein [Clostridia bacterium]
MKILDSYLENIRKEKRIAGFAVALTDEKAVRYARGFGVESVERPQVPVTERSLFRIASITKLVTGITVLQLVAEGKLALDAPVKEIIPWLTLSQRDAEKALTLRHLLSHTGGLPAEYTPDGPLEEAALEPSLQRELPVAQMASLPGDGVFLYSNLGIRLASLMAEKVTGKPFTLLAREMTLSPLGMNTTTFDLHLAATYPLCLPHEEKDGTFTVFHRLQENAVRHAAGGLYSNVLDLCRLARFINSGVTDEGKALLPPHLLKEMKTPHGKDPTGFSYGLTMRLEPYRNGFLCGHHGSAPPYATSLMTHKESGLGIALLMNTQRDDLRTEIPKKILDMLL